MQARSVGALLAMLNNTARLVPDSVLTATRLGSAGGQQGGSEDRDHDQDKASHLPFFFFGLIALTIFLSPYFGFCFCSGGVVTEPRLVDAGLLLPEWPGHVVLLRGGLW